MPRQRKVESFRIFQGIQALSHCRPILPLSITPGNTESQRFRDVFIGYRKETVAWNGLWPETCNFIKKETLHRCFPVNFAKFLRTPFLTEHLRWLLLVKVSFTNWYRNFWWWSFLWKSQLNNCKTLSNGNTKRSGFLFLA